MLEEWERTLKAAADPTRARIIRLLSDGELCVCQLRIIMDAPQSTISQHLGVLRRAGFIIAHRRGRWAFYGLTEGSRELVVLTHLLREIADEDPRMVADRRRAEAVLQVHYTELCGSKLDTNGPDGAARPEGRSEGAM